MLPDRVAWLIGSGEVRCRGMFVLLLSTRIPIASGQFGMTNDLHKDCRVLDTTITEI